MPRRGSPVRERRRTQSAAASRVRVACNSASAIRNADCSAASSPCIKARRPTRRSSSATRSVLAASCVSSLALSPWIGGQRDAGRVDGRDGAVVAADRERGVEVLRHRPEVPHRGVAAVGPRRDWQRRHPREHGTGVDGHEILLGRAVAGVVERRRVGVTDGGGGGGCRAAQRHQHRAAGAGIQGAVGMDALVEPREVAVAPRIMRKCLDADAVLAVAPETDHLPLVGAEVQDAAGLDGSGPGRYAGTVDVRDEAEAADRAGGEFIGCGRVKVHAVAIGPRKRAVVDSRVRALGSCAGTPGPGVGAACDISGAATNRTALTARGICSAADDGAVLAACQVASASADDAGLSGRRIALSPTHYAVRAAGRIGVASADGCDISAGGVADASADGRKRAIEQRSCVVSGTVVVAAAHGAVGIGDPVRAFATEIWIGVAGRHAATGDRRPAHAGGDVVRRTSADHVRADRIGLVTHHPSVVDPKV